MPFLHFRQFSQKLVCNFFSIFSSAVPPGSGAFQMPTRPSSVASVALVASAVSAASALAASASTLRGGGEGQSQKRFSNLFSF